MVTWKLYYGNGETFSSDDGKPQEAPCRGIVAAAWYDTDKRRRITHSTDYYWWRWGEDRWYGGDFVGLLDYLMDPGWKIVKFGRTFGDLQFNGVMALAHVDLPVELAPDAAKRGKGLFCARCNTAVNVENVHQHLSPTHALEPR